MRRDMMCSYKRRPAIGPHQRISRLPRVGLDYLGFVRSAQSHGYLDHTLIKQRHTPDKVCVVHDLKLHRAQTPSNRGGEGIMVTT